MAYDLKKPVTTGQFKKLATRAKTGIDAANAYKNLAHEIFIFELDDGTTVEKDIVTWREA